MMKDSQKQAREEISQFKLGVKDNQMTFKENLKFKNMVNKARKEREMFEDDN